MLRFTIRDLLWLTALVAVAALLWADRIAIRKERDWANKERAGITDAAKFLEEERSFLEKERAWVAEKARLLDARMQNIDRHVAKALADAEIEASKRSSAELAAPQPKPLPDGF